MINVNITALSAAGLKKVPVEGATVTFEIFNTSEELLMAAKHFRQITATINYKGNESTVVAQIFPKLRDEDKTVSIKVEDEVLGGIVHTDIMYE